MSWDILGEALAPREMHLLVSSMSARGRAIRVGPEVVRRLRAGGWDVTVSVTTPDDDPRDMAERSTAPVVAALGGDGFLSSAAQGVSATGALFVPMPGGRGNDLCRALGVGPDPIARAKGLAELGLRPAEGTPDPLAARVRPLDGMWVLEEGRAPRLVLGLVSFGLEARANQLANDSWFRSGPVAYAWGAFGALVSHGSRPCRALVDGVDTDLTGWVVSVSNSGWFGGGINAVPSSDMGDGVIELLHVGEANRRQMMAALTKVVATRSIEHPLVHVTRVHEIAFAEPAGLAAWADGDPIGRVPLRVRVAPAVVRVLT